MRTNVVLDDNLVQEAFQYAEDIHTKKDLIETALKKFVKHRKMRNLYDLKGKIRFADDDKKMAKIIPELKSVVSRMGTVILCPSFAQCRWARYGFAHPTST